MMSVLKPGHTDAPLASMSAIKNNVAGRPCGPCEGCGEEAAWVKMPAGSFHFSRRENRSLALHWREDREARGPSPASSLESDQAESNHPRTRNPAVSWCPVNF